MSNSSASLQAAETPRPALLVAGYALMIAAAIGAYLVIRAIGEAEAAGVPKVVTTATTTAAAPPAPHLLPHVILGIVVVIVCARLAGRLVGYFGQPRVIGEIVAGIVLGPSLLGRISPEAVAFLYPANVMPVLNILAQLGAILYMFLVGLDLNVALVRTRTHATVATSHASIVVPFILGAMLAIWLFPRFAPAGVSFTSFSMFTGVAMSVTAFPVLARILSDRNMERSEVGVLALSCAAADDVTAWCLLAFVVGVAQADLMGATTVIALTLAYIGTVQFFVRPWLIRLLRSHTESEISTNSVAWILVAVLVSSLITEAIGIHAIFGAFLIGAIIPHDSRVASAIQGKLHDVVTILLLPIFFACTGLRTQIGLLSNPSDWMFCGLIILVATAGKFGGTLVAARWTGLDWKTSSILGILMNTRGLIELIVLNIGLDLGIISPVLFAMLVLMALVTTATTTPALEWLERRGR